MPLPEGREGGSGRGSVLYSAFDEVRIGFHAQLCHIKATDLVLLGWAQTHDAFEDDPDDQRGYKDEGTDCRDTDDLRAPVAFE